VHEFEHLECFMGGEYGCACTCSDMLVCSTWYWYWYFQLLYAYSNSCCPFSLDSIHPSNKHPTTSRFAGPWSSHGPARYSFRAFHERYENSKGTHVYLLPNVSEVRLALCRIVHKQLAWTNNSRLVCSGLLYAFFSNGILLLKRRMNKGTLRTPQDLVWRMQPNSTYPTTGTAK
jgi:hypothetical protein